MPRPSLITPRFVGMWVFAFITFFSAFQLLPGIPFRILELGGSKAQAGWFLSVYTFASAFAAPLMGTIADHAGRRTTLVTASLLFIGFSLAYGVITNLKLLLVVGLLHGAIWSAILASASAIISDLIPEDRRSEGMAYYGLASNAAIAVAPAVGLWVYGFGWWILCVEMAVLSLFMAVAGWRLPVTDAHSKLSGLPRLADAWDWRVTKVALSLTATAFGYGGTTSYAALLAVERHITPTSLFFTVFAITIFVVRVFTSHLGDRFGPKAVLYPALAGVPVSFVMLAFAQNRWQLIASSVLFGASFGSVYPAFIAFILGTTNPRRRARTFGSIVWAFDSGIAIGSLVIGTFVQNWGMTAAFLLAAAISSAGIPIFRLTSRAVEETDEEGEAAA